MFRTFALYSSFIKMNEKPSRNALTASGGQWRTLGRGGGGKGGGASLNSYFESLSSYFESLNSYFESLNSYFETVADNFDL